MPPRIKCPTPRGVGSPIRQQPLRVIASLRTSQYSALGFLNPQQWPESSILQPGRNYATAAIPSSRLQLPADYVPPTQPPSARRPDTRKSQLLRTYTSLLRSTPLALIFQHNNLTSQEWAAVRRELRSALASVPLPPASEGSSAQLRPDVVGNIQLQVIRSRILSHALKIVEFFDAEGTAAVNNNSNPASSKDKTYKHDLSRAAFDAVQTVDLDSLPEDSMYAQVSPLLVGPVALLTFPAVTPQHLAAALSILAPSPPAFPPPSRRNNPGYHDPVTQSGLQKLLLIGGRVEDRVFDTDGVRWVGGISGGLDGLRGQLVAMLQNAGMGLTMALEGAGKSLWLTMEGRRGMLEDEAKGAEAGAGSEGEGQKEEGGS